MWSQKQRRMLDCSIDVLITTPGRPSGTLEEVRRASTLTVTHRDEDLVRQVQNLLALVLDEADRMISAGHFAEMDKILRLTVHRTQ